MTNAMLLSNQWASRPDHERFLTLESQLEAARAMEADLRRPLIDPSQLQVGALPAFETLPGGQTVEVAGGKLVTMLPGTRDIADLGYTGFGKAATLLGMPAGHYRDMPATHAAEAMKYRLFERHKTVGDFRFHVLPYRGENGQITPTEQGATSNIVSTVGPEYGFVPNAQIIAQLIRLNERMGGIWKIPAASYQATDPKRAATLYLGLGDLFNGLVAEDAFMDGAGRPIKVGFIIVNSWLQTKAFEVILFTYDYICDNRIIWNFNLMKGFKRRHTSGAPEQIKRELPNILGSYSLSVRSGETLKLMESRMLAAQAVTDLTVMETVRESKTGPAVKAKVPVDTPERAIRWMTDNKYGEAAAKTAVQIFMQEEGGNVPTSLWDMVQAGTAGTRGMGDAEARFEKDALVGSWLSKAKDEGPKTLHVSPGMPSANGRVASPVWVR